MGPNPDPSDSEYHRRKGERMDINIETMVSSGDIELSRPVHRREGGMPVGNGVMGTLVWTTPYSLGMQINRTDVYASDGTSMSFPERHSDYGYGCGYVEIEFPGFKKQVFTDTDTRQHLRIYDGVLTVSGAGVTCTVVAWPFEDVIAVCIQDRRESAGPCTVRLRMLRPPTVVTRSHRAESRFHTGNGHIVLSQEFSEEDFRCSSALGISAICRSVEIRETGDRETAIVVDPGEKDFTVLISSASAFDTAEGPVRESTALLTDAIGEGFDSILQTAGGCWHDFWERGFVYAEDSTGEAGILVRHYVYFLYLMASSSRRGAYPPNFGGMLWSTEGDIRSWGVQQWWNNLSLYYQELLAANRPELLEPLYSMYSGMMESAETAARQQWASEGIFYPETVWFNGLERLPEDIAAEMADLYLFRKPWAARSGRFREYAKLKHPHSSRWNWKGVGAYEHGTWTSPEKGDGPFGHVVHLLESNAKIAYLFWKKYEYTLDETWLRDRAYPIIRGVAEFFRSFPNLKPDRDGVYHIHHVNNSEGVLVARDTIEAITAMRGIFPIAIRAAEILGVDNGTKEKWLEVLNHLPDFPTSAHPDALMRGEPGEEPFWVSGLKPAVSASDTVPIAPILHFDLCNLEVAEADPFLFQRAVATFEKRFTDGIDEETPIHVMWGHALAAARLGRAPDWKHLALNQIACKWADMDFCYFDQTDRDGVLENRMTLREGVNALGAERLGNAAFSFQLAVCQDAPPGPGGDPVIRLFPAWPKGWRGAFKLRCRGGFVVQASIENDEVGEVEVTSEAGATLRLRNPWAGRSVSVIRNGKPGSTAADDLIIAETSPGEVITFRPLY